MGMPHEVCQNVDAASATRYQTVLRKPVSYHAGVFALAAMLGISALSSRTIARPLVDVVTHLRLSATTGASCQTFPETHGGAQEIRDLTQGFNTAAKAVRETASASPPRLRAIRWIVSASPRRPGRLHRGPQPERVSEYSCAIAKAMNLAEQRLEVIRVGGYFMT